MIVTEGSPLKLLMFCLTQRKACLWSNKPGFPGYFSFSRLMKPENPEPVMIVTSTKSWSMWKCGPAVVDLPSLLTKSSPKDVDHETGKDRSHGDVWAVNVEVKQFLRS